jgi:hypothetical protein
MLLTQCMLCCSLWLQVQGCMGAGGCVQQATIWCCCDWQQPLKAAMLAAAQAPPVPALVPAAAEMVGQLQHIWRLSAGAYVKTRQVEKHNVHAAAACSATCGGWCWWTHACYLPGMLLLQDAWLEQSAYNVRAVYASACVPAALHNMLPFANPSACIIVVTILAGCTAHRFCYIAAAGKRSCR